MDKMDVDTARQQFELENAIEVVDQDEIFQLNPEQQQTLLHVQPWKQDLHYFKKVKISALALLKMIVHAHAGGQYEIMGMLQGKVDGDTFVVLDTFALPVEGTETRVNAQSDALEYMIQYLESAAKVGRQENPVGWYHSHPGYGCWLSGIDVGTQYEHQSHNDPFLAIVVDPVRTMSAGKVEIGAFRTYPEEYTGDKGPQEYQTVPLNKIQDFGVHCNRYYQLPVSYFKSRLDQKLLEHMWNEYWVNTLSSAPLVSTDGYTTEQICDLNRKLKESEPALLKSRRKGLMQFEMDKGTSRHSEALSSCSRDASTLAVEELSKYTHEVAKRLAFCHCTPK